MKTKDVADRSNESTASDTAVAEKSESKSEKTVAKAAPAGDLHYHMHTPELAAQKSAHVVSTDIAKISAGLFVGVLALMTFLLSVGLQHPKPMIRSFLYVSYVALGLTLLAYVVEIVLTGMALDKHYAAARGEGDAKAATKAASFASMIRLAQNVLFVVAIVGTVGFALSATQLFFVTVQQPQATTQGQ